MASRAGFIGMRFTAAASALVLSVCAWAQNYPVKNITLVVPYPPGGGTDLFARAIAQDLTRQFEHFLGLALERELADGHGLDVVLDEDDAAQPAGKRA